MSGAAASRTFRAGRWHGVRRRAAGCALACWLALAGAPLRAQPPWPAPVAEALAQAGVDEHAMAAIVLPARGGFFRLRGFARDADRPMQPGSTMKVLTSIVALDRLGPNLRGRTELLSAAGAAPGRPVDAAALDGDVLRADLVLRGGADPELGWPQLWQLLLEVRERGIREIAGDIVLDRSLFRPWRIDQGLPPFDDAAEFSYHVVPDALMLNGNLMTIEISSDDESARVRSVPRLDGVSFEPPPLNDAPCRDWGRTWQRPSLERRGEAAHISLAGSFPRRCAVSVPLQLIDRDWLAELALRTLWNGLGGRWGGRVRSGTAPQQAQVLAQRWSRPLGEWLRLMNKQSDNTLARLLYLQLGVPGMAVTPELTTLQLAERAVRDWLAGHGIAQDSLVLDNGSGLSRSERLSPRLLAQALQAALRGRHAPELLMSLPTVGVDGTMRNRLKTSAAAGRARLKTGTLRNVVALAGVVPDDQGESWVLVALINHENARLARPALDALVDLVARGQPLWPAATPREP